ncbi:MAG TPA: protein-L-isoaspartate(D-aspartate) O-methyltransferase [Ktedonosporobacter sp.]|nr:protein-L-isoaspartate(D-aspartate) O-methyltransferase [Ktedonosporobacter sp.]
MSHDFAIQRQQLVASLCHAGIHDSRVLDAIASIPREGFVDEMLHKLAYADRALPISRGQTISQPLMVAVMTQALQLTGQERVLEIGTGSGYQTAILARLSAFVYSVERYQELTYQAALHLSQLALWNVSLYIGDGSAGWPAEAPYDRILVTAAAPNVPAQLLNQLVMGGMLVIPVGSQERQDLLVIRRLSYGTQVQSLGNCIFVPLIGEEGWRE